MSGMHNWPPNHVTRAPRQFRLECDDRARGARPAIPGKGSYMEDRCVNALLDFLKGGCATQNFMPDRHEIGDSSAVEMAHNSEKLWQQCHDRFE